MKRTIMFRAVASVLLFSLACAPDDVAQDSDASTATTGSPEPDAPPLTSAPPADLGSHGGPCQVDADCNAGDLCELRICVAGCDDAAGCDSGEMCDLHGRCQSAEGDATTLHFAGTPTLAERQTVLALGETRARTVLRNEGTQTLTYRLAAANPALTLDTAPAKLAPGAEVEMIADVDLAALAPADRILPVQIITSGGAILWSLEIAGQPEAGSFRGTIIFGADGFSLASSGLTVDLDFRDDGTIVGRVDTDASLLWPQPLALTGTWTAAGAVTIEMRDRLPAEGWRHSPIARDLGRVLLMTGTRTAAGLEGTITHTITGMRAAPVVTQGAFMLRRQGPLTGIVHAPDFTPKDATAPTWLAPPDLDPEACDGLGDLFGTDLTLPAPSAACGACTVGVCSPDDMVACGTDLRSAAYNLEPVLAALHGDREV